MGHQPRLLVLDANCLSYIDLLTGMELQRTALQLPGCGALQNFISIMMDGPCEHTCLGTNGNHIYICRQKPPGVGKDYVLPRPEVLCFSCKDLSKVGTAAELRWDDDDDDEGEEKEETCMGLTFSKGCMHIAMSDGHIRRMAPHPDGFTFKCPEHASSPDDIYKLPSIGNSPMGVDPSCMATGPDGNLYIVANEDREGDEGNFGGPFRNRRSYIMVGNLGATGAILSVKPFCGLSDNLVQPSGLCFDDQGNLYVTCITKRVLQYSGPLAVNPGQFMRVAAQWTVPSHDLRNTEKYFPHDVKWHKGIKGIGSQAEPLLLVVRQHGDWQCRLAIFSAVSGQLLKELSFPHEQDSLAPDEFSEKYILVD
ncbi:g11580 [Coccomyxa viridis]|uniref:G11580 protein n=1 Tax=Coccomyxa viridis TaxID=1274662 RepID=A0ABP1GCY8_9CHLO